ncbi:unnamed protein product [Onchocerca ochengi]|uniref:CA domain-containing protein n=1 Tax=Onchocerca ochengi TaxID=42157 RepID=A0A182E4V6_ONCOC|nr:unnamed protein product [Onchocerca ochengi]
MMIDLHTEDLIAFYDSRRIAHHVGGVPTTVLIVISGIAVTIAFGIAMASILYRHRRRLCTSSKLYRQQKSSFFATETESRPWDSLSFSCSFTDFSTSKMQFQSLESLSDDSYINSLDEAISYKASVVYNKSIKNASPKSITDTAISELSVSGK